MVERVYPAEPSWWADVRGPGGPHIHPPIMEELKAEARRRGLWNLFLPDEEHGAGLTNVEYAPLAESWGAAGSRRRRATAGARTPGTWRCCTVRYAEQKERWLSPLLEGEIRSAFAMTEPAVASSDATNISMRIRARRRVRAQRPQVVDDKRAPPEPADPDRDGQDNPDATTYQQQSMVLVPSTRRGQGAAEPVGVRLPRPRGPWRGAVQQRPRAGREHHRRRGNGIPDRPSAARSRADPPLHARDRRRRASARADVRARRRPRGVRPPRSHYGNIRDWIAESRIELEMARLIVMKTAWLMDTVGNRHARIEISGIKFAVAEHLSADRRPRDPGPRGRRRLGRLSAGGDVRRPAHAAAGRRPDEVHKLSLARQELRRQRERRGERLRSPDTCPLHALSREE